MVEKKTGEALKEKQKLMRNLRVSDISRGLLAPSACCRERKCAENYNKSELSMGWVDQWVGLGWVSQLMGWVGSCHTKLTHGQLWRNNAQRMRDRPCTHTNTERGQKQIVTARRYKYKKRQFIYTTSLEQQHLFYNISVSVPSVL